MNEPLLSPAPPAFRPRRRGRTVVLLILLPLLVLAGVYIFFALTANRELESAIAAIERTDPRWRLNDIEADRTVLPDANNAALTAMGTKPMMPAKWPIWIMSQQGNDPKTEARREILDRSFSELEAQRQLNKDQIDALRAELERASRALDKARTLAEKPEGRYPVAYTEDFIGTLLPHIQNTRELGSLLAYDVLLQAQEKHCDQALTSCRAIVNAARSIGDESMLISQLVRYALRAIAANKIQRVLAQGEPSEAVLRQLQQLLEKEESEPLLWIAVRGERAGMDRLMEGIQTGQIGMSAKDQALMGLSGDDRTANWIQTLPLRLPAVRKSQRAALLRHMTRAVEIAQMPLEQQEQEMKKLDAAVKDQPFLARLFCPALGKVAAADRRSRMDLRCAFVAVAAERYRQNKKKWPASLEALKETGYLQQIPMDLYDGQSLRGKRTADGLLIYSVGPDGQDNGGHIDRLNPAAAEGTDRVFHLWDVSKRRQEPAPPKPPPPPVEWPALPPGFGPPPDAPPGGQGK